MTMCGYCYRDPDDCTCKRNARRTRLPVLFAAILFLASCATWQGSSAKTLTALADIGGEAHGFVRGICGAGGQNFVGECERDDKDACRAFLRCRDAVRAIHTLESAVLVAQIVLKKGGDKPTVSEYVGKAVQAAGVVQGAIEGWE